MKQNIISVVIMSLMLTLRSPAAIGTYLIASSFISFIEELIYRLITRNKSLNKYKINLAYKLKDLI